MKREIVEIDGEKYVVETYENGTIVKMPYVDDTIEPIEEVVELSETEQSIFETQLNTEYLIALSELG